MMKPIEITLKDLYQKYPEFGFKDLFTCKKLYPNKLLACGNKAVYEIINANHILSCFNFTDITSTQYKFIVSHSETLSFSKSVNNTIRFTDNFSSLRGSAKCSYATIPLSAEEFYLNLSKNKVITSAPKTVKQEKVVNKSVKTVPKNVDRAYDLSVLNTNSNYPLDNIISGVQNFANQWKAGTNRVKTCTLLFHGFPGTGKTEFGKYLSAQTGLSFTVKRASEVFDKYVGETEKILSSVFTNARLSKSILMIDEADSFLESRTNADHTWEVSKVNELLCQLEQHEGIVICSTNFLSNLDSAALRRFIFKIEFKPLTNEGKHIITQRMLSEVCEIPNDLSELDGIDLLTPGDFKAVRDRLLIIHSDKISWEEVIRELKLEVQYKINDEYYKRFKSN